MEIKSDGIFYELEQGANKLRLVSEFAIRSVLFPGKTEPALRYCVWVIDRKDNTIKFAEFGKQITKQLQEFATNPEYAFDVIPSYDITINRTGTGQFDTKYSVLPDRKDTPLTEEEKKQISELMKPSEFLAKMNKTNHSSTIVEGDPNYVDPDKIPF